MPRCPLQLTVLHFPAPVPAAFAFVWSFLYPGSQSAAEHLLVYWAAPLASGLFGGWCFLGWQQFTAQRRQEQEPEHAKAE